MNLCSDRVYAAPMSIHESSKTQARRAPLDVVIAGGGVAALEAALALRALAGERVKLTLLTPAEDFVYRPLSVLTPFERKPPRSLALAEFASATDTAVDRDTLVAVDVERRLVRTGSDRELSYDALLVAIGASARDVVPGAASLHPARLLDSVDSVVAEVDAGSVDSVAFVVPRPSWPLPVYELALLLRERAADRSPKLEITIITHEKQPLEAFGDTVGRAAAMFLANAGIELIAGTGVTRSGERLIVGPGERELQFDRIIAAPQLQSPVIEGLPAGRDGFLPVDSHCRVKGAEDVFAAGDVTEFPVKFGAIAAQQADAAAAAIAALAGAPVEPDPFIGLVHGVLLAGRHAGRCYFSARLDDGRAYDSLASDTPTWTPEAKIAARFLGPYLDDLWAAGPRWVAGQLAWERALAKLEAAPTA